MNGRGAFVEPAYCFARRRPQPGAKGEAVGCRQAADLIGVFSLVDKLVRSAAWTFESLGTACSLNSTG